MENASVSIANDVIDTYKVPSTGKEIKVKPLNFIMLVRLVRKRMEDKFDWRYIADEYLEVIDAIG